MTHSLGIERKLHQFLLIILSSAFGTIEWTDAMCGKPGRTSMCRHADSETEYRTGENVTYTCNECFTTDVKERMCLENGSWSGRLPVCHKLLQLENVQQLSQIVDGKRKEANWTMDGNTESCSRKVIGSETVWKAVLTRSFHISAVELVLPGQDRVNALVQIMEGNKTAKTCGFYNGTTGSSRKSSLIFRCVNGLVGDTVHIVQYERGFRICEVYLYLQPGIENCVRPDSPHMGSGRKLVTNPKIYVIRCAQDYELVGEDKVECQLDGTWTTSSATCKRKTDCGQLPNVANGFLRVNATSVNSTAFLECHEGFRPQGRDRTHCLPTREWTSKSLTCGPIICDSNPRIRHGTGVLLDNSTYFGSRLLIVCDYGYTATESEIRECHENATWGNVDICVEINCGQLSSEAFDGEQWISINGTISIRVLICEHGYYIEGSPAFTQCLANGSWSFTNAVCKRSLINERWSIDWVPSTLLILAVAVGVGTAICIVCLVLSCMVAKKRRKSKTNSTVFHVGIADASLYTEGGKDQQCYKSTYEDVIELRHNSFSAKPRKPSSALPHLPIDADPVYAQPFETSEVEKQATVNTTDMYTAHIYAEPIDSHKHLGVNMYNNVAETWLKSGAKKFGRKMSLPGRSSLTEDSMLPASHSNIAVCKPVFHSSNVNSINPLFDESYAKTEYEVERQDKLELISNSIYSDVNDKSFDSCKDIEHLQMIDNDIYQDDYFTNV